MAVYPADGSPVTEIVVVEPNGSLRQVTGLESPGRGAAGPVWSPNGRKIAYWPSALGTGSLPAVLVVQADGTGQRLLHQLDAEEFSAPDWSDDGQTLLYSDATPPGDRRIWLTDVRSGEVRRIGTGALPRWLPDGRIVYVDGVSGRVPGDAAAVTPVVFIMDASGSRVQEYAEAENAHWSPAGDAVLIEDGGKLLLSDPAGTGRTALADGSLPAWSPDGSRIVYASGNDSDGRALLTVMDRDGREIWSGVAGSAPQWSPDGTRLAVEVTYPTPVVQVLDAETGEVLWEAPGRQPAWRP
jgi:Tol biopolymer transport system component